MQIQFVLPSFDPGTKDSVRILSSLVSSLALANLRYLHKNPQTPALYDLGKRGLVRYQREPRGKEEWCDLLEVYRRGWGDCEDLAAWRCAELQFRKIPAVPNIRFRRVGKQTIYHVTVLTVAEKDGKKGIVEEDPSRLLGMRARD